MVVFVNDILKNETYFLEVKMEFSERLKKTLGNKAELTQVDVAGKLGNFATSIRCLGTWSQKPTQDKSSQDCTNF